MIERKNKKLFICILLFFLFIHFPVASQKASYYKEKIIILFDLSEIQCFVCSLNFKRLLNKIYENKLNNRIFGILISDENDDDFQEDERTGIMRKKLKGFIFGNNIKFPVAIDNLNIFGKTKKRYDILIIKDNIMKGYKYSEFIKEVSKWKEY